jgi:hypothetical protein
VTSFTEVHHASQQYQLDRHRHRTCARHRIGAPDERICDDPYAPKLVSPFLFLGRFFERRGEVAKMRGDARLRREALGFMEQRGYTQV